MYLLKQKSFFQTEKLSVGDERNQGQSNVILALRQEAHPYEVFLPHI